MEYGDVCVPLWVMKVPNFQIVTTFYQHEASADILNDNSTEFSRSRHPDHSGLQSSFGQLIFPKFLVTGSCSSWSLCRNPTQQDYGEVRLGIKFTPTVVGHVLEANCLSTRVARNWWNNLKLISVRVDIEILGSAETLVSLRCQFRVVFFFCLEDQHSSSSNCL
jgi:hypothetical protein